MWNIVNLTVATPFKLSAVEDLFASTNILLPALLMILMSRALQKRFVCREVSFVGGDIALFPTPGISKYFFITIIRSISTSTLS